MYLGVSESTRKFKKFSCIRNKSKILFITEIIRGKKDKKTLGQNNLKWNKFFHDKYRLIILRKYPFYRKTARHTLYSLNSPSSYFALLKPCKSLKKKKKIGFFVTA
jgi:hypothetical protein